jgi:peptide-methionine (R)-S-oxide reductase
MNRRQFVSVLGTALLACQHAIAQGASKVTKLYKSKSDWKVLLTPNQYDILFEEGTERAGTSALNAEKRAGTFICAACNFPLFKSSQKYESGTGWPSFFDKIEEAVETKRDCKMFIPRTEYHCARCGGHQGHVFEDGPMPTKLRYCNNGLALLFVPDGTALPALRT